MWSDFGAVILDEEEFDRAIKEFEELAIQLQNLRTEIDKQLESLKIGFNTPAGKKILKSCQDSLLLPLDRQKLVIEHISLNLAEAKNAYSKVFEEYKNLNNTIKSYKP